jgi:hypothetical protein
VVIVREFAQRGDSLQGGLPGSYSAASTGNPAAFHAARPPSRWSTDV